ncbi:MAG: hypothetical protein HY695_16205 [Deltaproteobacteria bacterium]|nr:hypothetical protein [Deltaproteobacteria bacterium]
MPIVIEDNPRQCIYCKCSGVTFAREHVIPRAFGTFGPETMVLIEAVCIDCNQELGKELDEILARDSFEGLIRAEKLRPRRGKKDRFRARRILIRVPDEATFGHFRGARMAVDWKTRKLRPLDQILVRDESGKLYSFTESEIAEADEKLFRDRPPGSIQVIGTPAGVKTLQQLVILKGARFTEEPTEIEPPPAASEPAVFLETEGTIDNNIWRGIAKIAFNYLAQIQGAGYVLDNKFDRIREFIEGKVEGRALVRFSRQPILAHETPGLKTNEMHLVIFEREGRGLKGRVSLFNSFTYDVILCPDLGLIYSLKSGHAFDPVNKQVHKLTGISRRLKLGFLGR